MEIDDEVPTTLQPCRRKERNLSGFQKICRENHIGTVTIPPYQYPASAISDVYPSRRCGLILLIYCDYLTFHSKIQRLTFFQNALPNVLLQHTVHPTQIIAHYYTQHVRSHPPLRQNPRPRRGRSSTAATRDRACPIPSHTSPPYNLLSHLLLSLSPLLLLTNPSPRSPAAPAN